MDEEGNALAAWLAIARPVAAVNDRLESALTQRHGIGLSGFEALAVLAGNRGWTPLLDLCHSIELSQPRISRLVAQLAREGMVERAADQNDGRAVRCRPTRKGRRVHSAAEITFLEIMNQVAEDPLPVWEALRVGME